MKRLYVGLVVLSVIQIPLALIGFLSFFKSIPQAGDTGVSLDLRILAHLVWPVSCLMALFLARFPARSGSRLGVLALGLAPPIYGAGLMLSGL